MVDPKEIRRVPIEYLKPLFCNPPMGEDAIRMDKALIEDIRVNGIKKAIMIELSPRYPKYYIIANGRHRYFAAVYLGIKELPCMLLYGNKEQYDEFYKRFSQW